MEETGNISKVNSWKCAVADRLNEAAEKIRSQSGSVEADAGGYGFKTSTFLDKSADYVRNFDAEQFGKKIVQQVQQHPAQSLAIAAAAGLITGIIIRRR